MVESKKLKCSGNEVFGHIYGRILSQLVKYYWNLNIQNPKRMRLMWRGRQREHTPATRTSWCPPSPSAHSPPAQLPYADNEAALPLSDLFPPPKPRQRLQHLFMPHGVECFSVVNETKKNISLHLDYPFTYQTEKEDGIGCSFSFNKSILLLRYFWPYFNADSVQNYS